MSRYACLNVFCDKWNFRNIKNRKFYEKVKLNVISFNFSYFFCSFKCFREKLLKGNEFYF